MATLASYKPGDPLSSFSRGSEATYSHVVPPVDLAGATAEVWVAAGGGSLEILGPPVDLAGATAEVSVAAGGGALLAQEPTGAAFSVRVNGLPVIIDSASLSIERRLGEPAVCKFTIYDEDASLDLKRGHKVEVLNRAGTVIHAGPLMTSDSTIPAPGMLEHKVTATDWHYLFTKRIVAGGYENQSAGSIAEDLITTYMEAEGVTLANATIETGPTIDRAVFNYIPCKEALDELAERTGFWWYVDEAKNFYFVDRASISAPWSATSEDMISARLRRESPKYRNRMFMTGGHDITTDLPPEEFTGDGKRRTFVVGLEVAKVPTIKVNGSIKSVGIRGLDPEKSSDPTNGKEWFWQKGSTEITQDSGATPLASADTLEVDYQGQYPITALHEDPTAISEMQAIEGGGTGYVEAAEDAPDAEGRDELVSRASALVARYSKRGESLSFKTSRYGLKPGQFLTTTVSEFGLLAEDLLVESVRITAGPSSLFFTVNAIRGPQTGSWAALFTLIARRGRAHVDRINIGQVDVVVLTKSVVDNWIWSESVTITVRTCPVPASDTYPSATLYPC